MRVQGSTRLCLLGNEWGFEALMSVNEWMLRGFDVCRGLKKYKLDIDSV